MEENQRVSSYTEISETFGKKLIKLYGEKIFPRQGKVFADMLFQTGIEAGTYIASLADIEERSVKVDLATNAMIKLNQTAYLIDVMKEAGYYAPIQIVDIEEYLKGLLKAMRDLLSTAFAQIRAENARREAAALRRNQPAPQPQIQTQVPPKPVQPPVNPDPDGFNAPADGIPANPVTPATPATGSAPADDK